MFTGIIQSVGKVLEYDGSRLWLQLPFRNIKRGESICVDGVCLTVAAQRRRATGFDVGPETRRITTLNDLEAGDSVNLERALRVGDPLGGHWVTGHVEAVGKLQRIERDGPNRWLTIRAPAALTRYLVPKGSLAVDGISLTIVSHRGRSVRIMLVPHTLRSTTLGRKGAGDPVNLEADILAKYVLRKHS